MTLNTNISTGPGFIGRLWLRSRTTPPPAKPSTEPSLPSNPASPPSDPILFAQSLDFQPDPKQSELLLDPYPRIVVNCTRQWGKTTVVALKAVHHALSNPGCLVLVASPGERQSGNFIQIAAAFLDRLDIKPRTDGRNRISLKLPNGSRLVGLPEMPSKIRGFTASLLIIDEAAWVCDEMIHALRPTLAATGGPLWMLSTPGPATGAFYDAWHDPSHRWHRISVPATDCPRITPEFLEEEREALGDQAFRREYMCEFTADETAVFSRELITSAFNRDITPLFPGGRPQ